MKLDRQHSKPLLPRILGIPQEQSSLISKPYVKLSIVTQFFPPDFAATGQLIEELARHLAQQGVDVDVFTGQPGYAFRTAKAPTKERSLRLKIKRSCTAGLFPQRIRGKAINGVLFTIRAFIYLITASWRRNTLLVTTAPPFLPVLGYFANILFGLSYVCLLYDLYPDIVIRLGVIPQDHWLARFWRMVNRQVWMRSQGIIVLSPAMKDRISKICPEVEDKISVIHSWADPEAIVPIPKTKNWFAQEHQLTDRFTVIYSGNMGRCHDLETLLDAAVRLRHDPVQFVCIGGGAQRKKFMENVKMLGLDNFKFLPYQDKSVLPYSLTAGDLSLVAVSEEMADLVAPSKLYSALSAGRPIAVVCPKHSYLSDLMQDSGCGVAFENGDAAGLSQFIRFLINDRQQAEQMGQAGRAYLLENFTPTVIARQYHKVLRRAVASGRA
jgi:glycosyltransferase involved in cell wall biosynthesis